ncbi:M2 family metallopeptidase [Fulvivirga sediminis]|uniref:M2 family metallopeptidase n=1 Tax=Fulvivirga sediminis TaxID=2803949 RepID=A0A937JZ00_9BACT|nr:M2 family metallopeptidase [Fulvivirga sediminis]MBL3654760.1 M2 family metallopeptidase [Fulvivirga sediminis]
MKKISTAFLAALLFLGGCNNAKKENNHAPNPEVQAFLDDYNTKYLKLYYQSSLAEWESNTHIVEGDTMNAYHTRLANEALAAFTGSKEVIEKTREFLKNKNVLDTLQAKQLEAILYSAANNPATAEKVVKQRIKAEALQTERLFGYDYKIGNKSVSTNDIDNILKNENDLLLREAAWDASKEVGKELKSGLDQLRTLRNETVQALGYQDYFSYQVSDYGMSVDEMMALNRQLIEEVWPLYRELHTYVRYELAKKYGVSTVPKMIPAHWLPNRWGQDWSSIINVEGIDLDAALEAKGAEWLVKQAENFYVSLGFDPLPKSFYDSSSLYPAPADAGYKKNNHASAWHMDLQQDVRSLMSVIPNAEWYETTHHELGHIYYYMSYSTPEVPPLLRGGANRAFHEAIGSMMGLAATQKPFLTELELIPAHVETDETITLLKEALSHIVFIPFSSGVMTHFEHDLYLNNLPQDQFNAKWWEYKEKFQGIVPPTPRGEEFADATSKTHINNDAAQYYDYALSYALLFQIHSHIAKNILHQDPRATNYFGSKATGEFLHKLLKTGATEDWRQLLKDATGEDINAKAMLEYFQPLMKYLKEVNKGREYTLPVRPIFN